MSAIHMTCPKCGQKYIAGMVGTTMWPEHVCPEPVPQPDGVHTIPVPSGWPPEQAWEAIKRGDRLTDMQPSWANVLIENGSFVELYE